MPSSDAPDFQGLLVGVLVGGAARRMGGQPKGLLLAPGGQERLVPRLLRLCLEGLPGASQVLVGRQVAYEELGIPSLEDAASGAGPLAGLVSLLRHARAVGRQDVLLLACDLPYLSSELIQRLATFESDALAVAPRLGGRFEPLFARYRTQSLSAAEQALEGSDRSLQALLRSLEADVFPLEPRDEGALVDWDEPRDVSE